jgi:hypothetical protein
VEARLHIQGSQATEAVVNTIMIGDEYVVPTTRGEIRWGKPESWGVRVTERIYMQHGPRIDQTILLPWSVIELIQETA